MRYFVLPAAGLALALGAAFHATTPLPAQERPHELTGCYDITAAPDSADGPLVEVGSDSGTHGAIPARIEFAGPFRGFGEADTSRTAIVVPEGAHPSTHSWMTGEIVGDSLNLVFSTGYAGVKATLGWTGDRWVGGVRTFVDFGPPFEFDAGWIELVPASCDSPPPVPVDTILPITRSVESVGRLVLGNGRAQVILSDPR